MINVDTKMASWFRVDVVLLRRDTFAFNLTASAEFLFLLQPFQLCYITHSKQLTRLSFHRQSSAQLLSFPFDSLSLYVDVSGLHSHFDALDGTQP